MIELSSKCKQELIWLTQSSRLSNGKYLIQLPQQIIIQTDPRITGWGWEQFVKDRQQVGNWSVEKKRWYINILELLVVKLALLAFTK